MTSHILEKVKINLSTEHYEEVELLDFIQRVNDRLCLRIGVEVLPPIFESILVEGVVKCFRRKYYEGISSENADGLGNTFVDDILKEYEPEIKSYQQLLEQKGEFRRKVVRFL